MKKLLNIILLILSILITAIIFKSDFKYFFEWWICIFLMGILFYPLTSSLFKDFKDRGYIFSKTLGILISSYFVWLLSSLKVLSFTSIISIIVVTIVISIIIFIFFKGKDRFCELIHDDNLFRISINQEIGFIVLLAIWTYLRGINPTIEGLEKFMDFGYVNSILNTKFFPPIDMWFAGESINYYYFGQYISAFIIKISNVPTPAGYNLMMATLFALTFMLTYSLALNILANLKRINGVMIRIGATISALLVTCGGNLHHFIFGSIPKIASKFAVWFNINSTPKSVSYWFPDATRYIGYNPPTKDKTIHEFPLYSFVVSDLHAHVINMIFVLSIIAVIIATYKKLIKMPLITDTKQNNYSIIKECGILPEMLLIGLLLGVFQMSNYWDYPIYYVVAGAFILYANIIRNSFKPKVIFDTFVQGVLIFAVSLLTALPFILNFKKMASGIMISKAHTPFYQLLVLWGTFMFFAVCFFIFIIKYKSRVEDKDFKSFFINLQSFDIIIIILTLCGLGLILMPELIYVKDIYSGEHKRANTMFKLTYQAFIMLGTATGCIFVRVFVRNIKNIYFKVIRIIAIILIIIPLIYPFYAIKGWYGNSTYQGINTGLNFINNKNPDDYEAIKWLNDNTKDQPVILEANGDSYTYAGRISMATGLPTIQGWYVHEWLWRDDLGIVNSRIEEVKTVYESEDISLTTQILDKYNVRYIIIGDFEREQFPNIQQQKLINLGEVVFDGSNTIIIKR